MLLKILSLIGIAATIGLIGWQSNTSMDVTTSYFRYMADDIDFNNLKNTGNWEEDELPGTNCSPGDLPCLVSVDNLQDYGGIYSPGVIDEKDFARFLELQGSSNAQDYVTGTHQEATKE